MVQHSTGTDIMKYFWIERRRNTDEIRVIVYCMMILDDDFFVAALVDIDRRLSRPDGREERHGPSVLSSFGCLLARVCVVCLVKKLAL